MLLSKIIFLAKIRARNFFSKNPKAPPPEYQMDRALLKFSFKGPKSIYDNKEISFSQRLAVITLIHKKGDKKLLKNYRPNSLTTTDYKIIVFVFARRLQTIIDKLISNNQTAYVKGRFIGLKAFLVVSLHVPLFQRVRIISNHFCHYVNVKCSRLLILRSISVTSTFTVLETYATDVKLTNLKVIIFPMPLYLTIYSALFTLPLSTAFVV